MSRIALLDQPRLQERLALAALAEAVDRVVRPLQMRHADLYHLLERMGMKVRRSCGETRSSSSCLEMQPTQRALQPGETATAPSQRPKKRLLAVGHW